MRAGDRLSGNLQNRRLRNYLLLVREFRLQQLWDKAVETLEQALEEFPENPVMIIVLADTYFKMGSQIHAQQTLRELARVAPENGYLNYLIACSAARSGKTELADRYYRSALRKGTARKLVLQSYVSFLLQQNRRERALQELEIYKRQFLYQDWFTLLLAEALVAAGKKVQALRLLNRSMKRSFRKDVFLRYLQIKYLVDEQEPLITYYFLRKQIPGLPALEEADLRELNIQYLMHRQKWKETEKSMISYIHLTPDKLYWTRRLLDLKEATGHWEEFEEIATKYFLGNPSDFGVAHRLEQFLINRFRLPDWFALLRRTFARHPLDPAFFRYLRLFYQKRDWLQNGSLSLESYLEQVASLSVEAPDNSGPGWQKIPRYLLEYLVFYLNFTDRLLSPEELFGNIVQVQGGNPGLLPFDENDLRQVYPQWVFAIHFYFVFKKAARVRLMFHPDLFHQYGVAVVLKFPGQSLAIDISPLLRHNSVFSQELFKLVNMKILRWPPDYRPKQKLDGFRFFRAQDIQPIFSLIQSQILAK